MQLEIVARHFNLGDEQREGLEGLCSKLEKFSPRPVQSMKITISHEAARFQADAVLYLKNNEFRAKEEGMEPEYAVNELVESLRKQLVKFKGKTSGRQKGEEGGLGKALVDGEVLSGGQDSPPEGFVLRDMGVDLAKETFARSGRPFLIFRNQGNAKLGVIYKLDNGELAHMEARDD